MIHFSFNTQYQLAKNTKKLYACHQIPKHTTTKVHSYINKSGWYLPGNPVYEEFNPAVRVCVTLSI